MYWRYQLGLVTVRPETLADAKRALQLRHQGQTLYAIGEALGKTEGWACTLLCISRTCQGEHNGHAHHRSAATMPSGITVTCPATGEVIVDSYIEERRELVQECVARGMSVRQIADMFDGAWSEATIRNDLKALERNA